MNYSLLTILLCAFTAACGSKDDSPEGLENYEVGTAVGFEGSVELSFQQASIFRNIAISRKESSTCEAHAKDYMAKSNVVLVPESLKLTFDSEPARHCTRRNIFKQCESYQYIYTFHCRYQVQK